MTGCDAQLVFVGIGLALCMGFALGITARDMWRSNN